MNIKRVCHLLIKMAGPFTLFKTRSLRAPFQLLLFPAKKEKSRGSSFFISDIKEKHLSDRKTDKEIPVLKEMTGRVSVDVICKEVEDTFGGDPVLTGNIKTYLVKNCTGKRLKETGEEFGIGESGVSQTCRRLLQRFDPDKKLKKNIDKILKKLNLSRVKTLMLP